MYKKLLIMHLVMVMSCTVSMEKVNGIRLGFVANNSNAHYYVDYGNNFKSKIDSDEKIYQDYLLFNFNSQKIGKKEVNFEQIVPSAFINEYSKKVRLFLTLGLNLVLINVRGDTAFYEHNIQPNKSYLLNIIIDPMHSLIYELLEN